MDWSSLASFGGSALQFISSMGASRDNVAAINSTNAQNYSIMQQQMAFQREAMQNRHQWEVEDLKKAGLNPVLSANGGGPISMGASAVMQNPQEGQMENRVASARAMTEMAVAAAQVMKTKTETDNLKKEGTILDTLVQEAQNKLGYLKSGVGKVGAYAKGFMSDYGGALFSLLGVAGASARGVSAIANAGKAKKLLFR